jgi:tetratricopeptide (TPR) repeat protein
MVESIERLTRLVAAHGIYALVIIFIFYQERRAYGELKAATKPQERKYFQKVHVAVVALTFILALGATATWWLVNYSLEPPIVGILGNVFEQPREPTQRGDPAFDTEQLAVGGLDGPLYISEVETRPGSGSWQIGWAIPRTKADHLQFEFVHTRKVFDHQSLAEPFLVPSASEKLNKNTLNGKFTLHLAALGSLRKPIELTYRRHPRAPHDSLGAITVSVDGKDATIPWDSGSVLGSAPMAGNAGGTPAIAPAPAPDTSVRDSSSGSPLSGAGPRRDSGRDHFAFFAVAKAFAQQMAQPDIFGTDGSYDPRVGASLRSQLGGRDIGSQLTARNTLVSAGKRSIKFIRESLADSVGRTVNDRSALLHNLAAALTDIERYQGVSVPDLRRQMALTLYRNGSYQAAASQFATLSDSAMRTEDWYYRGYAHYSGGQYAQAITSLSAYLQLAKGASERSAAHTLAALCYDAQHQTEQAVQHYKKALELVPANGQAANNLAYLYAVQNRELPAALQLVDQALSREPTDPHYLDTKGWILYRQGKYEEALRFAEQAAKAEPDNTEILEHVNVIRKARTASRGDRTVP